MTIRELEFLIKKASTIYYTGEFEGVKYEKPLLSDAQFDAYVKWLRKVNPDSEVLSKAGWGYSPDNISSSNVNKVAHIHGGMNSIENKPRDIDSVPVRLRSDVRVSAKLDGLSGKMEFVDGKFVKGSTRGDGIVGIDKTDKFIELFKRYGEPQFPAEFSGEIRGEFVISISSWNKMLNAGTNKKNARNAASGLVNSLDISDEFQYLDFVPYKIIYDQNRTAPNTLVNEYGDCEFFCKCLPGFPKVPKSYFKEGYSFNELLQLYEGWGQIWPLDGVVITKNKVTLEDDGRRVHDEVAFKFETLKKITTLKSIVWQQSKNNLFIPVANFDPIDIDGSTISRATLHNYANVKAIKAFPGCTVEVMKSGAVIPYITQVVEESSENYAFPGTCPSCGSALVESGVHLRCPNGSCENMDKQNLRIWCNHLGNVDGFAETLLFQYFERFNISCIRDIYELPDDAFLGIGAEGSHSRLFLKVIDKLRNGPVSLESFLMALNIPRFGEVTCRNLCSSSEFVNILKEIICSFKSGEKVSKSELLEKFKSVVTSISGEATFNSLKSNISKFQRIKYVADRIVFEDAVPSSEDLIPVCITGKLTVSRKDFESVLRGMGYVVKDDVTKRTRFLITNENEPSSSKYKNAIKYGTQIVSEVEMLNILKGQQS